MPKRLLLITALIGGLGLFLLEFLRFKLRFSEIGLETYSAAIIAIGVALGFWASRKIKKEQVVAMAKNLSITEFCEEHEISKREEEVLFVLLQGKSNQEIADELHISLATVKTHVSNILSKTSFERRTQLISSLQVILEFNLKNEKSNSS